MEQYFDYFWDKKRTICKWNNHCKRKQFQSQSYPVNLFYVYVILIYVCVLPRRDYLHN